MERRVLIRRCLFSTLFLVLAAPSAAAFEFAPRVAFGPDPMTSMTIAWDAPADSSTHRLEYGATPDLGSEAKGTQRPVHAETAWPVYGKLEGLAPGTDYYYRVRQGETRGELHRFRTAPQDAAGFTFLAWGDQSSPGGPESAGEQPRRVIELANRTASDFVLILGDLSYADDKERWWNAYTQMVSTVARGRPTMTVPGNHDLVPDPNEYRTRFRMPSEGDDRWYTFRYANAQFIGLDTESVCNDDEEGGGAPPLGVAECPNGVNERQRDFLRKTLGEARSDPQVRWVIVYHHHGAYSSGKHGSNDALRSAWGALYDEYRVDLVLQAHDHLYLRSKPLRHGVVDDAGTTYVTAGTGGAVLYRHGAQKEWEDHFEDRAHGLVRITAGAAQLEGQFLSVEGEVLDSFTIQQDGRPLGEAKPPIPVPALGFVAWAAALFVGLRRARR